MRQLIGRVFWRIGFYFFKWGTIIGGGSMSLEKTDPEGRVTQVMEIGDD